MHVSLKLFLQSISAMGCGAAAIDQHMMEVPTTTATFYKTLQPTSWITLYTILVFPNWKNGPTSSRVRGAKKVSNLEEFLSSPILHHPSVRPILTLTPAAPECSVQLSRRRHRAPYLNSLPLHRATGWFP